MTATEAEWRVYPRVAATYHRLGWTPLPLPREAKKDPPAGYTGYNGRTATWADIQRWMAEPRYGNIALRLPDGVIGLDVDTYGQKNGAASLTDLENRFGRLPATYSSTSRGPGPSRILFYRVPVGTRLLANPAPDIETIQHHHRYAVVWPSLHPDHGGMYQWYDDALEALDGPPAIDMLTELPWTWWDGLRSIGAGKAGECATTAETVAFLAAHTEANWWDGLSVVKAQLHAGKGSRHDRLIVHACWTMREVAAGCYPGADARDMLADWWNHVIDNTRRAEGPELGDALAWAVGQLAEDTERVERLRAEHPSPEDLIGPPQADRPATKNGNTAATADRQLTLTPASDIPPRPVKWLWTDRIPTGTLVLLGGREGIGKSICAYNLTANITCGQLPGIHHGTPKSVIVAATEDSWSHTIVPRLMAAGADLTKVFRVDVTEATGRRCELSLPKDVIGLAEAIRQVDAVLVLLDPLMSRLDSKLDTHKDAEVRQALEPLVNLADTANAAVMGIIHVNKSTLRDALDLIMASRAFTAVSRAVLFAMVDPDDEKVRLLGQAKNNLGRLDLPTLRYQITETVVAHTDDGAVLTGQLTWLDTTDRTIADALESAADSSEYRTLASEAADWLHDYLVSKGGGDDSAEIKREAQKAGHAADGLRRARHKLKILATTSGFPRRTYWSLPGTYTEGDNLV